MFGYLIVTPFALYSNAAVYFRSTTEKLIKIIANELSSGTLAELRSYIENSSIIS